MHRNNHRPIHAVQAAPIAALSSQPDPAAAHSSRFIAVDRAPRLAPRLASLLAASLAVGAAAGVLGLVAAPSQAEPRVVRVSHQQSRLEVLRREAKAEVNTVKAADATNRATLRLAQLATDANNPAADPDSGPRSATPSAAPTEEDTLTVPLTPDESEQPIPAPPPADEETTPGLPAAPDTPTTGTNIPLTPATPTTPPVLSPTLPARAAEGREIANVRVVGNRVIDQQTVLLQAQATKPGFAFSPLQAERDRARIEDLGWFATVNYQVLPNLEDINKIDVVFTVVENRVVNGFEFKGNDVLEQAQLEEVLQTQKGTVLNRQTINSDAEKITSLFRKNGYFVLITDITQNEQGTVVFSLSFATISQINIEGLKKTSESLVRRQIRTEPGDVFNEVKVRQDLNRIFDMGFFEDINFKVDDDPASPGSVILTIVVKERRTGQLSLGVGFDSRSKISGFVTVSENNFRGSGRRVGASLELGSQRSYSLSFGDPFVGEKNASYDVSIFDRRFFREPRTVFNVIGQPTTPTTLNYEEQRQGGRINYSLPLDYNRNSIALFGYRNEKARLFQTDNIDNATPIALPQDSSGRVSAFSIGYVRDKRDLRIDPSRGGREQLLVEKAFSFIGGETDFTKIEADLRRYLPLMQSQELGVQPKLVLAGRVVLGQSLGQLPAFEQYFIGGPDTVRGYDVDEQFGDNQLFANFELRYRFQNRFQLVGFFDAGTAYGGRFASNDGADVLTAVGFGVRLQTPIGPVRLDIGFGGDGAKTHFAIGPTF